MLAVACGSVGALTATTADRLEDALGRTASGDWTPRRLPALALYRDGEIARALNDVVLVRAAAGQVAVKIFGDERSFWAADRGKGSNTASAPAVPAAPSNAAPPVVIATNEVAQAIMVTK